ncbi:DUF6943 family protein [Flavobacterium sp. GNP001]
MLKFIVKTHRKDIVHAGNQIYILSKGLNSGKPQKEPFTNSFVIILQSEEDAETVYWLAYSLWKAKFWHQSLCGSVIPFLRLTEFKKSFNIKVYETTLNFQQHQKRIKALKILEQQAQHFQKNLTLINELRSTILHGFYNR